MKWIIMVLTCVLYALKLVGIIKWSWWLVFAPLLAFIGLWLLVIAVAVVAGMIDEAKK